MSLPPIYGLELSPRHWPELKGKITEEIGRIDAATLERVMESVLSRARSSVAHNGGHLTDVVFPHENTKFPFILFRLRHRLSVPQHGHTTKTKVLQDFWDTL